MSDNSITQDETQREVGDKQSATTESGAETNSSLLLSRSGATDDQSSNRRSVILAIVATAFVATATFALWMWWSRSAAVPTRAANAAAEKESGGGDESIGAEVKLSPEAITTAGIEIESVTERPAVALVEVTGTVEVNQETTQAVTPLVSGRVERVFVSLGDRVRKGEVLATISSPQIAQLHGKLHESETQLAISERNLARVQRAENRAAVLQAKARLDEAESTLKRIRKLVELGAGAGKDLVAAETAYRTAKAEHDFQSNISLNREIQESGAAVETARVDVAHIRDELRAFGAPVPEGGMDDHANDTSLVPLRAASAGVITDRMVNAGAGIEAGKPLFTISNLSSVWVIANVPEAQLNNLRIGNAAEIRSSVTEKFFGRIGYVDPQLNEETRTARVRVEVNNPGGRLKTEMFVQVGFQTGTTGTTGLDLMVPSDAIQRVGERLIVFVPKENEHGQFEVRTVVLGDDVGGYRRIVSGLRLGERVVTKGSFVLKAQLLKSRFAEEE